MDLAARLRWWTAHNRSDLVDLLAELIDPDLLRAAVTKQQSPRESDQL